jgi:hypothetical protein
MRNFKNGRKKEGKKDDQENLYNVDGKTGRSIRNHTRRWHQRWWQRHVR